MVSAGYEEAVGPLLVKPLSQLRVLLSRLLSWHYAGIDAGFALPEVLPVPYILRRAAVVDPPIAEMEVEEHVVDQAVPNPPIRIASVKNDPGLKILDASQYDT